jgi:hypothetical protein
MESICGLPMAHMSQNVLNTYLHFKTSVLINGDAKELISLKFISLPTHYPKKIITYLKKFKKKS